MSHLALAQLEAGLEHIRDSPTDRGRIELIVRRPAVGEREVVPEATLDVADGLVGDTWKDRFCRLTADGSPHPDTQLTLMNSRVAALVARTHDRWPLAGDQFYVDLDLSTGNIPAGTRLGLGSAVIEVTDQPHAGCGLFVRRFGVDAMKFVNSNTGRELHLRGVNAKVIVGGAVHAGDLVTKAKA
jgi:hypothetical protein